jgi:hypothetical protein
VYNEACIRWIELELVDAELAIAIEKVVLLQVMTTPNRILVKIAVATFHIAVVSLVEFIERCAVGEGGWGRGRQGILT